MAYALMPLAAPLVLSIAALIAWRSRTPQSGALGNICEAATLAALAASVASAVLLLLHGPATSPLIGALGLGLSIRLDIVSTVIMLLVSFIGWIVVRYAATYMIGNPERHLFLAKIILTLIFVMLFVMSGNVAILFAAWIATSLSLHKLLVFFPERAAALRAAKKKYLFARVGDVALFISLVLLVIEAGTGDIASIASAARSEKFSYAGTAAVLLAIAAMLKSAQFPSHGWLTEVMEAPTPVSALLHAGVINAGGYLLIRFSDIVVLSHGVMATLLFIGGFTAIFGSLVMLAQPQVKTSLAWSTIAQMGFMIFQCGLALFPLALLHIVAHSLYKAHAFLSSGSAIETVAKSRQPGPVAIPGARAVLRAFGASVAIYIVIGGLWGLAFGFDGKSPQLVAVGAILVFGVAYLIAQGLADTAPRALTMRTSAAAVAMSVSYFALQAFAGWLTYPTLLPPPATEPLQWFLIALAFISFGAVALAQGTFPLWAHHPAAAVVRVHLARGLYINAIVERLMARTTKNSVRQ